MSDYLKKIQERSTNYLGKGDVWDDTDAAARWPILYSLLATSSSGDVKREPTKLTVYCQQGGLFVCLRCHTEKQVAQARVDHHEHPFDTIEELLEADKVNWRTMGKNNRGSASN